MSWNVILWACTWTQRRGFSRRNLWRLPRLGGLLCRHEMLRLKKRKSMVHFAGIWWSNISEICVSRCVFFWNFSGVPHFSRTKLGCTSPKQQDMPRDIYQPQFCSLRASKLHVPKNQSTQDMKIFRGGAWIIYAYVFNCFYITSLALFNLP